MKDLFHGTTYDLTEIDITTGKGRAIVRRTWR